MEKLETEYAIGLDLGTTFSCIGVYRNGGVEIIPNRNGEKITPSIVIITNDSKILVGEETINYLVKYYDGCIYEIKRLIGRKFSDKEVQMEMEKLPFKIVHANEGDSPEIEVTINGEKKTFNPVEISAFIIKKMVNNAEIYLNKKIKKLVITVPAYFNDSQRKLTRQAAETIGLKVIQVINEPTAAALSYGFGKNKEINGKILVFDLGGGTFDVSILTMEKDEKNISKFKVIATSGDTQLGGEDFDNELVEYFIKKGNFDNNLKEDKRCLRRLKVACENIKKILSSSKETILRINNLYNNQDLNESITRDDFEKICGHLFAKLEVSLDEALKNAKLSKDDINEIILVGGSTRIPKVKEIIKNYFPNCKNINDSINPDEAVAYGATIGAEKLLHNKDHNISNIHLYDIIPLSLGVKVSNQSKDPDLKKEGDEMSVIIKRGTPVPTFNTHNYYTKCDKQKKVTLDIYEGEKRYVKYNHLLKSITISNLTERPKGKTCVIVTFEIDHDGILTVKAKEKSEDNKGQYLELTIKNDEISLTEEQIEQLKKKNEQLLEKMKENEISSKLDYSNLKDTLKKYKEAFEKCKNDPKPKNKEEEDPRIIYITNYNTTLEEFIDNFDKNFDNETILEKLFLYVRELFSSYVETLPLGIDKGQQKHIMEKIKEYLKIFLDKSSGYMSSLLEILEKLTKNKFQVFFYEIIIYLMEELNNCGKDAIKSNKKFCKYHSLIYFEQANSCYEKYLANIEESKLGPKLKNSRKKQKEICSDFIRDINSGVVVLFNESFNGGYLVPDSLYTGFTQNFTDLGLANIKNSIERCKIVLANYEKVLSSILTESKRSRKEAICIANIIKLYSILGQLRNKRNYLISLAKRVEIIVDHEKINKEEEWYKEFVTLNEKLKAKKKPDDDYRNLLVKMKRTHGKIFDEIDNTFTKGGKEEFIKFILEKYPYPDFKKDKDNGRNFEVFNLELIQFLSQRYQPQKHSINNEENELKYCITQEISKKLSNLLTTL